MTKHVPPPPVPPRQEEEDWRLKWQTSDRGVPIGNVHNALIGLREDGNLSDILTYDQMARTILLTKPTPDITGETEQSDLPRPIRDTDITNIQEYLQIAGLTRLAKEIAHQAVEKRAEERGVHPVKDYLVNLRWDGELRLKGWLNAYMGVEHGEYASRIGPMFLTAMVARIFEPGCQADYMLVLEGGQGIGKSTACAILAGDWFSNNLPDIAKSDMIRVSMHLRGKWLIEIAELSSFSNVEITKLKEFITTSEERYTPKYARSEAYEPRQCLFIGTTNKSVYLRDETGGRRFWPVKCGTIDLEALKRDRDQLFAEAVRFYQAGVPRFPDKKFEDEFIKPQQEARFESDAWETAISHYLIGQQKVMLIDVAQQALDFPKSKLSTTDQRRIAAILERMGWERAQRESGGIPWIRRSHFGM